MNKKGEVGVGTLVLLAVVLIVGVIFFQTIAQSIGTSTNTVTLANESFTFAAESGSVYLTDYRAVSDVVIYNATGTLVPAANYTVTNNVVYNGALAVQIDTGVVSDYANDSSNISATAQPLTYIADSGSRAMANLIIIFFAILLIGIALQPVIESKFSEMFGR